MRPLILLLSLFISLALPLQSMAGLLAPLAACPAAAQDAQAAHCCQKNAGGFINKAIKHCKADQGCENFSPLPAQSPAATLNYTPNRTRLPGPALAALPLTAYPAWRPPENSI